VADPRASRNLGDPDGLVHAQYPKLPHVKYTVCERACGRVLWPASNLYETLGDVTCLACLGEKPR
jgi:hypothetical protein